MRRNAALTFNDKHVVFRAKLENLELPFDRSRAARRVPANRIRAADQWTIASTSARAY